MWMFKHTCTYMLNQKHLSLVPFNFPTVTDYLDIQKPCHKWSLSPCIKNMLALCLCYLTFVIREFIPDLANHYLSVWCGNSGIQFTHHIMRKSLIRSIPSTCHTKVSLIAINSTLKRCQLGNKHLNHSEDTFKARNNFLEFQTLNNSI